MSGKTLTFQIESNKEKNSSVVLAAVHDEGKKGAVKGQGGTIVNQTVAKKAKEADRATRTKTEGDYDANADVPYDLFPELSPDDFETQSGFVPGWKISDNIVVFQEVIHTMRKNKGNRGFMAIKIDLEKAYDRLCWDFIRDTLNDMCIPAYLVDVIMECVTTSRMQILWNGEPTEMFTPSRGVRQGDPLSSYLFVMCLEKLQQLINAEVRENNWKPISVCLNGPRISNLFFADDMVLFAEATTDQAAVIIKVLDIFCQASGEKETIQKPKAAGGLGITSSRQANAAFLTKLGWRVLVEPQSLWSRVLRAKYCNGRCDVDMFTSKANMSNVWAGILSHAGNIAKGTTSAVGNGHRTLFWDPSWVEAGTLSDIAVMPIPNSLLGATVSDMWDENNWWRNNVAFGRSNENPTNPSALLHQQFEASKQAFDRFSLFIPTPDSIRNEIFIRWHPPPLGWCLLNTDGASKGNPGPAGCGGIFRDDTARKGTAYRQAFNPYG
ncbi:uncharacterized protein LOC141589827 [Silene latifolia]|uniref:uncharacterized protein LOC141589827 n=1 Tax=Silene latifolia TaxID=37657 RepID=UPI003D782EC3